jgi:hypothetical protein
MRQGYAEHSPDTSYSSPSSSFSPRPLPWRSSPCSSRCARPSSTRALEKIAERVSSAETSCAIALSSSGSEIPSLASRSLPPVFSDPLLAKANYDALEKQVEERIKAGAKK